MASCHEGCAEEAGELKGTDCGANVGSQQQTNALRAQRSVWEACPRQQRTHKQRDVSHAECCSKRLDAIRLVPLHIRQVLGDGDHGGEECNEARDERDGGAPLQQGRDESELPPSLLKQAVPRMVAELQHASRSTRQS